MTFAAALGRGDFESGSDSKSGLFVANVCTHILGQCPLTFAAAFVLDDFESGSDSKSGCFVADVCAHIDVHRVGQRLDSLCLFLSFAGRCVAVIGVPPRGLCICRRRQQRGTGFSKRQYGARKMHFGFRRTAARGYWRIGATEKISEKGLHFGCYLCLL